MIRGTARRAGVRKAVNPHLFRHSRATYLAGHLTEAQRLYPCMNECEGFFIAKLVKNEL